MNSTVYNCLIVDDEPPAREVLKRYIQKLPMLNLAGECSNAIQVMQFLREQPVDLLFLDIQMPQLSGLELVNTLSNPPKIIFTTAFAEYALQSYELDAVDYLLKPIRFERFVKAINKALPVTSVLPIKGILPITEALNLTDATAANKKETATGNDDFLYFRADRKMVKVILKEILYIESLKDYVKIKTEDNQVITKYSMAALEAMLPATQFIRIHRSFIIALAKLSSYTTNQIQIGNIELPIGKLYQREVLKVLEVDK